MLYLFQARQVKFEVDSLRAPSIITLDDQPASPKTAMSSLDTSKNPDLTTNQNLAESSSKPDILPLDVSDISDVSDVDDETVTKAVTAAKEAPAVVTAAREATAVIQAVEALPHNQGGDRSLVQPQIVSQTNQYSKHRALKRKSTEFYDEAARYEECAELAFVDPTDEDYEEKCLVREIVMRRAFNHIGKPFQNHFIPGDHLAKNSRLNPLHYHHQRLLMQNSYAEK